jgi:hypothetical protein
MSWAFQPILPAAQLSASSPPATAGYAKIWTGTAWEKKPVKIWNGTQWVIKPVKHWTGTAWTTTV